MSFHQDVKDYIATFAPQIGPVRHIETNQLFDDTRGHLQSTAVVGGIAGVTENTISRKQWKVFYNAQEELTSVVIPKEEWIEER